LAQAGARSYRRARCGLPARCLPKQPSNLKREE
jgi:hypothetical protein